MSPINSKSRRLFEHANSTRNAQFYTPAEDTYLFLDALEQEIPCLVSELPHALILEVGPGSGVLSAFLSASYAELKAQCFSMGIEFNMSAICATESTFQSVGHKYTLELLQGDTLTSTIPKGFCDILLCNPPYVPCEREGTDGALEYAWAGGLPDGREVIDKLIEQASSILSPNGRFYLLLEERNFPDRVMEFAAQFGFSSRLVMKRKVPGETLYI